jgi:transposase InsO family protein
MADVDNAEQSRISLCTKRLDSTNFHEWKPRVSDALMERYLWEYAIGECRQPIAAHDIPSPAEMQALSDWKKKDNAAAAFIRKHVNHDQLHVVPAGSGAYATWTAICAAHEKQTMQAIALIVHTIVTTQYVEGGRMEDHVNVFRLNNNKLLAQNTTVHFSDQLLAILLLKSLPPSFTPLAQTLGALTPQQFTFAHVSATLLDEERRRHVAVGSSNNSAAASEPTALFHRSPATSVSSLVTSAPSSSAAAPRPKCTYCSKRGHTADVCYQRVGYPAGHPLARQASAQFAQASGVAPPSLEDNGFFVLSVDDNDDGIANIATQHHTAAFVAPHASTRTPDVATIHSTGIRTTSALDAMDWLIDSGATQHYCHHKDWFDTFEPVSGRHIVLGDGRRTPIVGQGTLKVDVPTLSGLAGATFHNVAYAPGLSVNLLSVSSMDSQGLDVQFKSGRCIVRNGAGTIIAAAHRVANKLYQLTVSRQRQPPRNAPPSGSEAGRALSATVNKKDTARRWHERFAHINTRSIATLFDKEMVTGVDCRAVATAIRASAGATPPNCHACALGKSHRLPFPTSTSRARRPLELIHTDLKGPMPASNGGARYLMVIMDDCTRYVWEQPLRTKGEAAQSLLWYIAQANNLFSHLRYRVQTVRSDNGGEYLSTALRNELADLGITAQYTTPHTPQQNGAAERMMRTLVEAGRTMLHASGLSSSFWAEAVHTAVYIRNRSVTTALDGMTPYEAWFGKKPAVGHLRAFGCVAYAYIPSHLRRGDSLKPKARRCIMLGYSLTSKSYRLWDPERRKAFPCRDVVFHEDELWSRKPAEQGGAHESPSSAALPSSPRTDLGWLNFDDSDVTTDLDWIQRVSRLDNPNPSPSNPAQNPAVPPSEDEDEQDRQPLARSATNPAAQPRPQPVPRMVRDLMDHLPSGPRDAAPSTVKPLGAALVGRKDSKPDGDPVTLSDALSRDNADRWQAAAQSEYDSLQNAGTYDLVQLPPGRTAIGCKWVFKTKLGSDGSVVKHKARLVAKGYSQKYGLDYEETYAPVVRYASLRALLALAAHHDWEVHHMDVKSAYLNGNLAEEIYMEQPEGFKVPGKETMVCRLKKGLYGLKQAGRSWHQTIDPVLKGMRLIALGSDHCVYLHRVGSTVVIIALYVDDLFIFGTPTPLINTFKKRLQTAFEMEDLGEAKFALGIEITRDRASRTLTISQRAYINSLIERFGQADSNAQATPVEPNTLLQKADASHTAQPNEIKLYQSAVGALQYAASGTRPDISFAVSALSKYSSNPDSSHFAALKRLFRYLRGTSHYSITYKGMGDKSSQPQLLGYSDSDWANDRDDRRSVTGYAFLLSGGAISWSSKKQHTTAQSSTEAEYMAGAEAVKEAIWWRNFLSELGYNLTAPTILFSDNQSAIALAENPEHHARTKHIDVKYHLMREHIQRGTMTQRHVKGSDNPADVLTKALPRDKHTTCATSLGITVA